MRVCDGVVGIVCVGSGSDIVVGEVDVNGRGAVVCKSAEAIYHITWFKDIIKLIKACF